MPCWNVIENTCDIGQCDRTVLIDALKDMGANPQTGYGGAVTFSTEHGTAFIRGGEVVIRGASQEAVDAVWKQVKQAITRTAIKKAAAKFGWKIEVSKDRTKIKLRK